MKWGTYCVILAAVVEARFIFPDFPKDETESTNDYIKPSYEPPASSSSCGGNKYSSLVEHFFNTIFAEFHNPRPVCVCVQLCPDKAMSCFPNHCYKSDQDEAPSKTDMFKTGRLKTWGTDVIRKLPKAGADLLQEKYKNMFKFKKTPSIITYNRGEQIRNAKRFPQNSDVLSRWPNMKKLNRNCLLPTAGTLKLFNSVLSSKDGSLDLSKTRWPLNKINKIKILPPAGSLKFLNSLLSTKEVKYPLKYYKRDILSSGINERDINKNKTDISNNKTGAFSFEKLINSLIEDDILPSNTIVVNETDVTNIKLDNGITETNTDAVLTFNISDIISMNDTSLNLDKTKYYMENNTIYKNIGSYNDLIVTLSERTDDYKLAIANNITGDNEFEPNSEPLETTLAISIDTTQGVTTTVIETTEATTDTTRENIQTNPPFISTTQGIPDTTQSIQIATQGIPVTTQGILDTTQSIPKTTQSILDTTDDNKTTTKRILTTQRLIEKRSTKKIKQLQKRRPSNKNTFLKHK